MNFNVYLDDATVRRLDALAKREKLARNALIRRAVDSLLRRDEQNWPDVVMQWQGDPDAVPFEDRRSELGPASDDPLGLAGPKARSPRRAAPRAASPKRRRKRA